MATGINGFTGTYFDDLVTGSNAQFKFTFVDEDGGAETVTGWKVYVSFSESNSCGTPDLEVVLDTISSNTISGDVTAAELATLTPGTLYACAKYIKSDDSTYTIDMAKIKLSTCLNSRVAQ